MKALAIAAALVAAIAIIAGVFLLTDRGSYDPGSPEDLPDPEIIYPRILAETSPSQWSHAGGDLGSFGVSDSKTPITEEEMALAWSVTGVMDSGTNVWKVPSSPLCVDDRVYYYKGEDCTLHCCGLLKPDPAEPMVLWESCLINQQHDRPCLTPKKRSIGTKCFRSTSASAMPATTSLRNAS
jgi:hypothetical protein